MESMPKGIMEELRVIREGIEFLKKNIIDKDMFLTKDEEILLKESYENEGRGELVSSEQLKKDLEI